MIIDTIFSNLIHNNEYARKVIPFLKDEYFDNRLDKFLFRLIKDYSDKFNNIPSKAALKVELENASGLNDDEHKTLSSKVVSIEEAVVDEDWLLIETEKFCQDRAVYNAIMKSIEVFDGRAKDTDKGSIPKLLSDALAVSFASHIGHDFFADQDSRYDFYHKKEKKIPFDLDYFNRITKGFTNGTRICS